MGKKKRKLRAVPLYETLVEKAAACSLPASASPLRRFKAVLDLYTFLDETDLLEMFISVGYALHDIEGDMSPKDKTEARKFGVTFPEDWENPLDYFRQEP